MCKLLENWNERNSDVDKYMLLKSDSVTCPLVNYAWELSVVIIPYSRYPGWETGDRGSHAFWEHVSPLWSFISTTKNWTAFWETGLKTKKHPFLCRYGVFLKHLSVSTHLFSTETTGYTGMVAGSLECLLMSILSQSGLFLKKFEI